MVVVGGGGLSSPSSSHWRSSPQASLAVCFLRRGVGCILYEMATGRPMFPGATVKEELHLIFRLMGKSPSAKKTLAELLLRLWTPAGERPRSRWEAFLYAAANLSVWI